MYAETVRPVKKPERRRRSKAAVSSFQRPHVIQNLKKSIGFAQKQDHTGKMENSTDASNTNADGVQVNFRHINPKFSLVFNCYSIHFQTKM